MPDVPPEEKGMLEYRSGSAAPVSGLAMASLVLGLVAVPMDIFYFLGMPLGLVAIGLGIVAVVRVNRLGLRGKPFAIAGIVLGILSILVGIGCGFFVAYSLRGV